MFFPDTFLGTYANPDLYQRKDRLDQINMTEYQRQDNKTDSYSWPRWPFHLIETELCTMKGNVVHNLKICYTRTRKDNSLIHCNTLFTCDREDKSTCVNSSQNFELKTFSSDTMSSKLHALANATKRPIWWKIIDNSHIHFNTNICLRSSECLLDQLNHVYWPLLKCRNDPIFNKNTFLIIF